EAERGRLPRAVRAEESHHLPARDAERDVLHGGAAAEPLGELPGLDHPTASRTGSRSGAPVRRRRRKRGRMIFIQAGTMTSPPKVLNTMSSARRSPISAWNFRSENHQKIMLATIVVAVRLAAGPR